MMTLHHDSRDPAMRSPGGARPGGQIVRLRLRARGGPERVLLRIWWAEREWLYPMAREAGDLYAIDHALPAEPGLLFYYFIAEKDGLRAYYGQAADNLGGPGAQYAQEPPSYQITVYDARFAPPAWLGEGLMYQIMVDRFRRAGPPAKPAAGASVHADWYEAPILCLSEDGDNEACDFFGGNLRGVMEKLDYLHDLGVTVIYFNPIFRARSNHKYDTGDYEAIDPSFGDEADFRALCKAAAAKGMRVMLDGVFSHTGSDSRYFNKFGTYPELGAYQSQDSEYASWYDFRCFPGDYDCWWGFDTLPNVRELDEGYLRYMITGERAIVARWLRAGAAGWRLDVADELPLPFLRLLRARVKQEDAQAAVLGEVWEDASNKVSYGELRSYCLGDTLDSVMNYPLREALIEFLLGRLSAQGLKRRLDALYERYPKPFAYALMNLLGSHDRARIVNVLSGEHLRLPREARACTPLSAEGRALGLARYLAAWQFVCALPGMPAIYYGDEAGLEGGDDPFCRRTYPWGAEDRALLASVRAINRWRAGSAAARRGTLALHALADDLIAVERRIEGGRDALGAQAADEAFVCLLNRGARAREVSLTPFGAPGAALVPARGARLARLV